MIIRFIKFGLCFIVFTSSHAFADAVYTWTDASGIIHISESKPPENVSQSNRFTYTSNRTSDMKDTAALPTEKHKDSLWLNALEQAKHERKNAEKAREMAEDAIRAANLLKKETDEFLEPWRNKKRIKREILLQIDHRIQTANESIDQAEALIQKANKAEQTARNAELEAKRVEQELFEKYQQIMSN
jgi:hypothetical protein